MARPTFNFCVEIGAREVRAPKTRPFKFGNGNERRYRFGLVTDLRTWELECAFRSDTEREDILEFLEERGAWKPFYWTDPKGHFASWRCASWETTWNGHNQQVITCTFRELDERFAEPAPPQVLSSPDMWVSRCTSNIGSSRLAPSGGLLLKDGSSIQAALVELQSNPAVWDIYVIKRNIEGEVVWQKRIANPVYSGSGNSFNDKWFVLCEGSDGEVYIGARDSNNTRRFAGDTAYNNNINLDALGPAQIWCVNADGALRWQKSFSFTENRRPNGTVVSGVPRTVVGALTFDSITGHLIAVGQTSRFSGGGASTEHTTFVLRISASTGALVNHKTFWTAEPGESALPSRDHSVRIANARVLISGSCSNTLLGTPLRAFVIETDLSLSTVFSSYLLNDLAIFSLIPSGDGGWYAVGIQSGLNFSYLYKLSASFQAIWRQRRNQPGRSFPTATFGAASQENLYCATPSGGGTAIYGFVGASSTDSWRIPGPVTQDFIDSSVERRACVVFKASHESGKVGIFATQARLSTAGFTNSACGQINAVDEAKNIALGWYQNTGSPTTDRLAAYGFRVAYPDRGQRWLDAGISLNSSYQMFARSQIDQNYAPLLQETSGLPTTISFTWPTTTDPITTADPGFGYENGALAFNHYAYRDPVFTSPVTTGSAGLAFYAGNDAVQKVSTERLFTPSLVVHANRTSAANRLIFNAAAPINRLGSWNAGGYSTSVNSMLEYGNGFFKISGRESIGWNRIGSSYVALCFASIAGGYSSVAYTGDGTASRVIAHGLGAVPQFCFVENNVPGALGFPAGGSLVGAGFYLDLFATGARLANSPNGRFQSFNSTNVTLGSSNNSNGSIYTAHFFASCSAWDIGTYQGAGTGLHTQTLGYQPRAIIIKSIIGSTSDWRLLFRADNTTGIARRINLNSTAVEADDPDVSITATGFTVATGGIGNNGTTTALYLAIR